VLCLTKFLPHVIHIMSYQQGEDDKISTLLVLAEADSELTIGGDSPPIVVAREPPIPQVWFIPFHLTLPYMLI